MKRLLLIIILFLFCPLTAFAVPVLQVGAPAGLSDAGLYADYNTPLTNPTEDDTAVTFGNELLVAGVYLNDSTLSLGGQYNTGGVVGLDWTDPNLSNQITFHSDFAGHGAILLATVPESQFLTGSMTVGGLSSFFSSLDNSYFPNNHAPVDKAGSAYLFFDIGEFSKTTTIPDFDNEVLGTKEGEIKSLALAITGFDWVHFDVMALQTGPQGQTELRTTLQNNPGSHDVTWKEDDGGGGGGGGPIPEPATLMLFGFGLLGLAGVSRRKK